jgi:hypothetical protein
LADQLQQRCLPPPPFRQPCCGKVRRRGDQPGDAFALIVRELPGPALDCRSAIAFFP